MTTNNFLLKYSPYFIYLIGLNIYFIRRLGRQTKARQIIVLLAGFLYFAVLGLLCLVPQPNLSLAGFTKMTPIWVGPVPTNPIPFRGIGTDFYLNILLTLPLGLWAPLTRSKFRFKTSLALGFGIGLGIESLQFILDWLLKLNRWVDINDVLMNALGVIIGWLIFKAWGKLWPNQRQKFKLNR
ncbi:VanZ family protein [Agrilactobacillus yilanensis]|uniref:VanZ family protein n=1 Tax=Agrilactobacillus yilanensis TaxID=2485997 RepID=A0ABW4J741_9LACO|nr:VanZ family protein [Agrilactobacillus yilanensis]